ncbi:MAG: AraC family transcriptional regulator [Deltaproteobacteria bacterium]|nr:AraC family transcriptional regulator [Deltaproteobacteria bacterium]
MAARDAFHLAPDRSLALVRRHRWSGRIDRHAHRSLILGLVLEGECCTVGIRGVRMADTRRMFAVAPGEVHAHVAERPCSYVALCLAAPSLPPGRMLPTMADDRGLVSAVASLAETIEAGQWPGRSDILAVTARAEGHFELCPSLSGPPWLSRVVEYLERAIDTPFNLAELENLAGVSRFHLCRTFTARMGMTPGEYQLHARLWRAKDLLTQGVSPVETALETGFADQSHLTRRFNRVVGLSPGLYARGRIRTHRA